MVSLRLDRTSRIAGIAVGAASIWAYVQGVLRTWRQRREARRELARLDARLLRDVGLDPDWVKRDARKPFWET